MSPCPIDTNPRPQFNISRTAHLLHASLLAAFKEAEWDLSPEQTQGLLFLEDVRDPINMKDLAEEMMRDPTTLKRQLDALVDKELVRRTSPVHDRRQVQLELTAKGAAAAKKVRPLVPARSTQGDERAR